jgi:dihydrofolate reductase
MRKLIESCFVSLDGVVEGAEVWGAPYYSNEENRQHWHSKLNDADALLFGRVTFELFHGIGMRAQGDPYFDRIGSLPKFVASTTLREVSWNATQISSHTADKIAELKRQPGKNILKYGNGSLDKTLVENSLIDEFNVSVFPVVAGKGRKLFEGVDTSHLKLKLSGVKQFSNGVVTLTYVGE